jgi:hypothetical protein
VALGSLLEVGHHTHHLLLLLLLLRCSSLPAGADAV